MKRITSIILCVFLVSVFPGTIYAQYEDSISRVCAVGIMGDVEDGDFRPDDNITRAEFTTVTVRMLGMFNLSGADTSFSDVENSHWASGCIKVASDLGLVNGRGNGVFSPEDNVTYNEAVKIIVCALGRELAMANKDYPISYIAEGESIGLTKGLEPGDRFVTRREVAAIIDNALDIHPVEPVYGTGKFSYDKQTVYQKLAMLKETSHFSGIFTKGGHINLTGDEKVLDGYITVGSKLFRTDKDYSMYIGQLVDVYYTDNEKDNNVVYLAPRTAVNRIYTLSASETYIQGGKVHYRNDEDKEKSYNLDSQCYFMLNGDKINPGAHFSIHLGNYTLIDNNGNGNIDAVLITQAESFVAESVSTEKMSIYFDNNRTYHARGGIALDYEDREFEITDSDGNRKELSYVEPGDAISIVGNSDDSYIKIIVNKELISASIEGISENEIVIGENTYEIGKDNAGNPIFSPYLGMEASFVIDVFGYCVGTFGNIPDRFTYAYIADAIRTQTKDSGIKLKIISGLEPEKEVKISAGKEKISYHLQNDEFKIFELADSVKFGNNPKDASGVTTKSSSLDPAILREKIVGYTLNSDGKINALNIYSFSKEQPAHKFNADIFSFGGMRVSRGYVRDEDTVVVCVPYEVRSEKDYYTRVTLADEDESVAVYGVKGIYENEYGTGDANSEPADIIVLIRKDMNSEMPPVISEDNDICIIGKITKRLSEAGDEAYSVELLNGSEKLTYEIPKNSFAFGQAKSLRKGDLIQFTLNSRKQISGISKLASVQGLEEYTSEEYIYGIIEDVRFNVYDFYDNKMVDKLKVNAGNDDGEVNIYKKDGQNIYLYDRAAGFIYPATSDDIMAASYYGEGATKVFAYTDLDGKAKVIVLIKD